VIEGSAPAVLIMAYSRADMVKELLESIPSNRKVYIFLDGPTSSNKESITETRLVIEDYIGLPENAEKEISFRFKDRNLGPKLAFIEAISWAFLTSEYLIILEEDVRFSSQFFPYMDWCLERFKDNQRIGQINGFSPVNIPLLKNYLFETQNSYCWGWGTWRDRWNDNDVDIAYKLDSVNQTNSLSTIKIGEGYLSLWHDRIMRVRLGFDTWDFQWNLSMLGRGSYAISPSFSLVTNIGINAEATNTKTAKIFIRSLSQLSEVKLRLHALKVKRFPSFFNTLSDLIQFKTVSVTPRSGTPIMLAYSFLLALRNFFRHL